MIWRGSSHCSSVAKVVLSNRLWVIWPLNWRVASLSPWTRVGAMEYEEKRSLVPSWKFSLSLLKQTSPVLYSMKCIFVLINYIF